MAQIIDNSKASKLSREQQLVKDFCEKHKEQLAMWQKTHPKEKPPVFYDEKEDKVIWMNRKARREKEKENRRKFKKKANQTKTGQLIKNLKAMSDARAEQDSSSRSTNQSGPQNEVKKDVQAETENHSDRSGSGDLAAQGV